MSANPKGTTGLLNAKFSHHAHGPLIGALSATCPGQAHCADLSSSHRCKECVFWVGMPNRPADHRCAKAQQLAGRPLPPIPANARACKYFEARQ
jgi:hypothetical protein